MPRPGPRPYECVRRAWHSERHQPIRGSLIQDIFRQIAHEIHSPGTKKKKEWQEKLPIVVLKAEEIMYSKANSEVEYMDPKTLWDRTNDAINTIIRRDESSEESGDLLQPCIEAALHLGCIPRRTSRSQRNNHPRCYLTGNTNLPMSAEKNGELSLTSTPHYSNFLGKEPQHFSVPVGSCLQNEMHFLSGLTPLPPDGSIPSKSFPVYPLYYGNGIYAHPKEPHLPATNYVSANRPETTMSQTLPLCSEEYTMPKREVQISAKDQSNVECDLSLRLGYGSVKMDEKSCSNGPKEKIPYVNMSHKLNESLTLCCGSNAGSGGDIFDLGLMVRKRKAVEPMNDQRCSFQPKIMPAAYSNGRS